MRPINPRDKENVDNTRANPREAKDVSCYGIKFTHISATATGRSWGK